MRGLNDGRAPSKFESATSGEAGNLAGHRSSAASDGNLQHSLNCDQDAAAQRALLRVKAAKLRMRIRDAEGAAARLGDAQAELLIAVGEELDITSDAFRELRCVNRTST